jgi:signal transduction histidine kinase
VAKTRPHIRRRTSAKKGSSAKGDPRLGWVRPFTERELSVFRFNRSHDALISGVAGGVGERIGVDPIVVRVAFVALSAAGAIGVIAYLAAWSLSLDPGDRRGHKPRPATVQQDAAFGAIVVGLVLLFRSVGLWFGDLVGFPILVGGVGAAVVYVGAGRDGKVRRARGPFGAEVLSGRPSFISLVLGGLFVVGGVTWFFLTVKHSVTGVFAVVLAVAVTAVGLAIVFGPWVYRLTGQLGEERRERIRSEERSELAAHLHDSVLQTLALIQRSAHSPRKMANLARRQERELRAWLYGSPTINAGQFETFEELVDQIENEYEVTIETVLVGSAPLNERTEATALALLEAAKNAARHSGAEEISVYIECDPKAINAYVRDRGRGFDPDTIPNGRRGIADSIRGRVERHGGTVTITSAPGEGCEVQVTMPMESRT